jgi:hypothetical protein
METHEDIIKHLRDLVRALDSDKYTGISRSNLPAKEVMRNYRLMQRLKDCLTLIESDQRYNK